MTVVLGFTGNAKLSAEPGFASLPGAHHYVERLVNNAGSLTTPQIRDILDRLRCAYAEFPELDLDYPRSTVSAKLLSCFDKVGGQADIGILSVLLEIIRFDPSSKPCLLELKRAVDKLAGEDRQTLAADGAGELRDRLRETQSLLRHHQPDRLHCQLGQALARIEIAASGNIGEDCAPPDDAEPAAARSIAIDDPALLELIPAVRQRVGERLAWERDRAPRDELLVMAARLDHEPASRSPAPRRLAWPSGRLSFGEFVLQWPCRIELPADLDGDALIIEAHKAILLREPTPSELTRYRNSQRSGEVSPRRLIEELLNSSELHRLERIVDVVWGGDVLSGPGEPHSQSAPRVQWAGRPAAGNSQCTGHCSIASAPALSATGGDRCRS